MLVSNYKANDVVSLKLVTGEEVLGYYVSSDNETITLRKPVVPVQTGQNQMGLAPFLMSSDYMQSGKELQFSRTAIITDTSTSKAFADAYTQQVSGLDLRTPSKPGLITG